MTEHGLGRRPLPEGETKHLERYGLREVGVDTVERTLKLPYQYRLKYNQGEEGACVGFALSWAMSILNRKFYSARDLYLLAQTVDEWPGEGYSGTSVRAGCDVLRTRGHKLQHRHNHVHDWDTAHGIERNEWCSNLDQLRACIANGVPVVMGTNWYQGMDRPEKRGNEWWLPSTNMGRIRGGHAWCIYAASDRRQACKMTNSWGKDYPLTWVPYALLERLLNEDGEATVITDRR